MVAVMEVSWAPVAGFEGRYEVARDGRVRSLTRVEVNVLGVEKTIRGKELKAARNRAGYCYIQLGGRECQRVMVHNLVWDSFGDGSSHDHIVTHANGDRSDNRIENLSSRKPGERKVRLSPAALARLLRYEPDTGTFTWRPRERGDDIQYMKFNKSVAGHPAFTRKNAHGYLIEKMFSLTYAAGRVAWCLHYGRWPDNFIDHINGDPTDNRIENLRDVEASENARNCAMPVNNTSGIVGVSRARSGKWIARILYNGRYHHLGTFASKEDAASARASAERRLGFHPNHGRVRHAK